jgi:hypothetical protein
MLFILLQSIKWFLQIRQIAIRLTLIRYTVHYKTKIASNIFTLKESKGKNNL